MCVTASGSWWHEVAMHGVIAAVLWGRGRERELGSFIFCVE